MTRHEADQMASGYDQIACGYDQITSRHDQSVSGHDQLVSPKIFAEITQNCGRKKGSTTFARYVPGAVREWPNVRPDNDAAQLVKLFARGEKGTIGQNFHCRNMFGFCHTLCANAL